MIRTSVGIRRCQTCKRQFTLNALPWEGSWECPRCEALAAAVPVPPLTEDSLPSPLEPVEGRS